MIGRGQKIQRGFGEHHAAPRAAAVFVGVMLRIRRQQLVFRGKGLCQLLVDVLGKDVGDRDVRERFGLGRRLGDGVQAMFQHVLIEPPIQKHMPPPHSSAEFAGE